MKAKLKTKVDEKLFGSRATVTKELVAGERYVYTIKAKGISYLLKGYSICLEHLKPGDQSTRSKFMEALYHVGEAYKEYFLYRILSMFNPHFAKPLALDYEVQLAESELEFSYAHFEIIFEFAGEPLSEFAELGFSDIYNLIRQSANTLSILHNAEVAHYDIKPGNLLYDGDKNLLRVMNMESAFGYESKRIEYKGGLWERELMFTLEFASPEILKANSKKSMASLNSVMLCADVYSWAMSFYSLILSKSQCDLINEAKRYKLGTEEDHTKFLDTVSFGLKKVKLKTEEEEKKMVVVKGELLKALNYKPEKRPSMSEIVNSLKKFEKEEKFSIPYSSTEQQIRNRLMKTLVMEDEEVKEYYNTMMKTKSEVFKEYTGKGCKNCEYGNNVKAELSCKHSMCIDCIVKILRDKFMKKEYHNHRVVCNVCKKNSKMSNCLR